MKISAQRDSAGASYITQAKGIKKQRNGASFAAKKRTLPSLSTVLCDDLESYDRVLSCASKGKLYVCSLPELHSDYIEKNFSILSGALFQTRFSSLISAEDIIITAVALEDSEVVQDLAALQWLDGARKDLVLLSPEEGTILGERQPDCVSKETLAGLADGLIESSAAISSLKTSHPADTPVEGSTELVVPSADDCYRPDMSMLESIQVLSPIQAGPSMCSPDQRVTLYSQEEILMNSLASQPEGGLLIEPSMPFSCSKERSSHLLPPLMSHGNSGSASQEEHVTQSNHTSRANIEISDARSKLESEVKDMIEKFPPHKWGSTEDFSQNHRTSALCTENHVMQEAEPLVQPNYGVVSKVKQQFSYSLVSSPGLVEEPAKSSPLLLDSEHNANASQGICQAEVKSELSEKIDLVEKLAMEALELNILHSLFKEYDLSGIQLLDETASQGNMPIVANMHDFVELEEDQSSNSSQIQEAQLNFPVYVVPSPQQTSAKGDFVGFLGLLAQVSARHSSELNSSKSSLEEEHAVFNSEARSCTKRLFTENESDVSVLGEAARLPERKTKKLNHFVAPDV